MQQSSLFHQITLQPIEADPPPHNPPLALQERVYVRFPDQTGTITHINDVAFWVQFDRTKLGCWYPGSMIVRL